MSFENSPSAKRIKQSYVVTDETETKIKADFVNLFSDELNLHVFRYLDAKDLSACARVSSHWHRLVNDPQVRIQDHYHDCFYYNFLYSLLSYSLAFPQFLALEKSFFISLLCFIQTKVSSSTRPFASRSPSTLPTSATSTLVLVRLSL